MGGNKCHGNTVAEKDGRKIIDCERCGYMHVFPMYSTEELESFYKDVYSESTPSHIMHEKVYNVKKWKGKGAVLDIGCWEGTQLEYFIKEGWKCTGIELNKKASKAASSKGIEVHNLSMQQFFENFGDTKWDVINLAYILEHIPSPKEVLLRIRRNIKKDGIVIIEVPNEFNSLQFAYLKKKGISPYWIALPDHINYFNRRSLEALLKNTGWKVLHGESSFPMEVFLLMGDDYLEDPPLGKKSFKKVVEMEESLRNYDPGLVSKFYSSLYTGDIGRSIILYVQPEP